MGWLVDIVRKWLNDSGTPEISDPEELRQLFQERYQQFRLLLTANNHALEIMSELEEALSGSRLFGMHFVRSRVTQVSAQVYRIIQHLNRLAPDRYAGLFDRFQDITRTVEDLLVPHQEKLSGELVMALRDMDGSDVDQAGAKMANLAEIAKDTRFASPDGFVITAAGCDRFLSASGLRLEISRRIQAAGAEDLDQVYALSSSLQALVSEAELPEDLERAMVEQVDRLRERHGSDLALALRSSALGEDMAEASFAGQFRTELNVRPENVAEVYKEIVASLFTARAMTYRLERGLPNDQAVMCVGVLRMVRPEASGVLYTRNPVAFGDDTMIISSVWGLPRPVVDGSLAPDTYLLSRTRPPVIKDVQVADKPEQYVCSPDEGVCRTEVVESERDKPSLADDQAVALGELALALEDKYGQPLDLEWAVEKGRLMILQCRPLKQLDADRAGRAPQGEAPAPVLAQGGMTASPGMASGHVFRLIRHGDALRVPDGSVLVTTQALPRWAPLLSKASAVVAERGSVTSHLANVAREAGTPALFGLAGALDLLPEGEMVTVDADARRVMTGMVDQGERPKARKKAAGFMLGTPVYRALEVVAEHILPLHLLDPDSTEFRPRNAATYHDITRFCHEQAVREMFRFGRDHAFPERSGKQLVGKARMQWWVLNLDDGFTEEVEGNQVSLDSIASVPMLALWEGITVLPWEGPPALDSKGFLSVMFRATTNPALAAGAVDDPYADRNYFMISKNYVSLSSRFGFHFTTVEALVGDRVRENYIAFTFKGGAADDARRVRRIRFVADMLEDYGFRSRIKEDHLSARLENRGAEFMKTRLRILGYLIIHTRQLDMIMNKASQVVRYRNKFHKEISEHLGIDPGA